MGPFIGEKIIRGFLWLRATEDAKVAWFIRVRLTKDTNSSINSSRLSSRQDRSNDDIVYFGTSRNLQQWIERAKCETSFAFQINSSVRCWDVAILVRRKPGRNVRQRSIEWFDRDVPAMDEIFRSLGSFSHHCSARLWAMKVWGIIENRECSATVHGFSKPIPANFF